MKLIEFAAVGYRSLVKAGLAGIGDLNVIVGRNNSGKSNALSAIHHYLKFVTAGQVTAEGTAIRETDLSKKNEPAIFSGLFEIDDDDLHELAPTITDLFGREVNLPRDIAIRITAEMGITARGINAIAAVDLVGNGKAYDIFSIPTEKMPDIFAGYDGRTVRHVHANSLRHIIHSLKNRSPARIEDIFGELRANGDFEKIARSIPTVEIADPVKHAMIAAASDATTPRHLIRQLENAAQRLQKEADRPIASADQPIYKVLGAPAKEVPYAIHHILGILARKKVLYLGEKRGDVGEKEATRIVQAKMKKGGLNLFGKFQQDIAKTLGVSVDGYPDSSDDDESPAKNILDVENFPPEANGAGVRGGLSILFAIDMQRPDFLLIEEPEMHMHPGLEFNLLERLRTLSATCQTFLTTHSTNFIDSSDHRTVYLTSKNDNRSHITAIQGEGTELEVLHELGVRLSSVFMYERLVFVEGNTDADVFRKWANTLGVDLTRSGVGFVPMGGVKNFRAFASSATIETLSKRRVRMAVILDRDELEENEIQDMQKRIQQVAALRVLRRRELENYMFVPFALAGLVQRKKLGRASVAVSVDELEKGLVESIENLRTDVIARRVMADVFKPVYPDRKELLKNVKGDTLEKTLQSELQRVRDHVNSKISGVPDVLKAVRNDIDSRWDMESISLVAGDVALDNLLQKTHGLRFRKEQDSVVVAGLMRADDIDDEIREIITWLTTF